MGLSSMNCRGFTLLETLVATAIGALLAGVIFTLGSFGQRSFVLMANDSDLDLKSRNALRLLTERVHGATAVTGLASNNDFKALSLTNAREAMNISIKWTAAQRKLVLTESRTDATTETVLLTACDEW